MTKKEEIIQDRIDSIRETISRLTSEDDHLENRYDNYLDSLYPVMFKYDPSVILQKIDSIQYYVGLQEYRAENSNEDLINELNDKIEELL